MHQSPGVPQLHPALAWNREDTASSKEPREAACFEQLKWTNGKRAALMGIKHGFLENRTLEILDI